MLERSSLPSNGLTVPPEKTGLRACRSRCQKKRCIGGFVRIYLGLRTAYGSAHPARMHAVDHDASRTQIGCERLGIRVQRRFAEAIRGRVAVRYARELAHNRRHVNDTPSTCHERSK